MESKVLVHFDERDNGYAQATVMIDDTLGTWVFARRTIAELREGLIIVIDNYLNGVNRIDG